MFKKKKERNSYLRQYETLSICKTEKKVAFYDLIHNTWTRASQLQRESVFKKGIQNKQLSGRGAMPIFAICISFFFFVFVFDFIYFL